jgi:signal transduction histidine kinase/CheY-like chemotaxis protein
MSHDSNQGVLAASNSPAQPTPPTDADGPLAGEQRVRAVSATFRKIFQVVLLIFVFAVVQLFMLWRVCNTGMTTAASLEHQGLPTLNALAALQEHLAIYRLNSYEYLFAREADRAGKAKDVESTAVQMRAELAKIKALLPAGDGRQLASNLEDALNDLDSAFRKVRSLVDPDFAAAMKEMDQNIPPITDRVADDANALEDYGYQLSGAQANATFGSFGWIKSNAIMFAAGNIFLVLGAVLFILLAARYSRAQLSDTLARLDLRTQELAGSLSLVHATLEATADGILLVDTAGRIGKFNHQFTQMWRISDPADILTDRQQLLAYMLPLVVRAEAFSAKVADLAAHPELESFDVLELKDSRVFECCSKPQRIHDRICGRVWSFRDTTERRRFESRLFESQKMETVGRLAGGVAHEFNSIMTAIIGQSELLLFDLPPADPLRSNATEIHQAAERAAALTRQLLAYGRKQILQTAVLDLNTVLLGMTNTLRHLAGRQVDVHILPASSPILVKADSGQIQQVIVNIVMNATDAMPRGGKLTLETTSLFLDQGYVSQFQDLKVGDYAMLAITDTGTGMSNAVKARLFEPFFTTKDVGQGTGLGLATCHGIIKQSGGHIAVYSEPGRGTTFKIYLPAVRLENLPPGPPLRAPSLPTGTETILLVEDDPALREMASALLARLGYSVLTAADGLEALHLTQQRSTGHIDLLFTDVVMPNMSGKELADRIQSLFPRTKTLFTSAYTENAIAHQGVLNPGITLLQKPFTPTALAKKVREVLDPQGNMQQ